MVATDEPCRRQNNTYFLTDNTQILAQPIQKRCTGGVERLSWKDFTIEASFSIPYVAFLLFYPAALILIARRLMSQACILVSLVGIRALRTSEGTELLKGEDHGTYMIGHERVRKERTLMECRARQRGICQG